MQGPVIKGTEVDSDGQETSNSPPRVVARDEWKSIRRVNVFQPLQALPPGRLLPSAQKWRAAQL